MAYLDFALRGVGIFGSASFFGMTLSISTITLPMLFRHKQISTRERVELWSDLYDLVTQRWVPFGLLSSAAYAVAAYTTRQDKTLPIAAAISMFSVLPLTLTLVMPYVKKLKALIKSDDKVLNIEGDSTLKTWGVLHWSRTLAAGTAAVLGLVDLVRMLMR
ncbi:hypothetical protein MPSI1_003012 [Malassezia psittaci]|uniref:DUF1772-domain-containing protein n=1 Tax=Malassezia psittaci TaxID=1821823 RepID=A0AAF0FD71_9BASI|nr:hypothetical protein MPSI1_003012 [Malassezia psittaci]